MCAAALAGDVRRATELHLRLLPLHRNMFCEPSPAPAKWALSRLGRCRPTLRLPLVEMTDAGKAAVAAALADCGIA
jgi:4-hydroxy-tetrahydrodipicolinate synthase